MARKQTVYQYDENLNLVKKHRCMLDASKINHHFFVSEISRCINGYKLKYKNHYWLSNLLSKTELKKYIEEFVPLSKGNKNHNRDTGIVYKNKGKIRKCYVCEKQFTVIIDEYRCRKCKTYNPEFAYHHEDLLFC